MWKSKEFRRDSKILDFKTHFKTAVKIIGLVYIMTITVTQRKTN